MSCAGLPCVSRARRLASLAALLPCQLTESVDHVGEKLADDRLVVRAYEAERVAPAGSGQGVVVLADAPSLVGHEQPDHPPVNGIAAALDIALSYQRVHHR